MNEAEFQERFEDLTNDYDFKITRGYPIIDILREMYGLIGTYIAIYNGKLYENKNPQNGVD